VVVSIGNALEWFDFASFGFFATTIAALFFPTGDPALTLLLAFASFGVTFLLRPLGAVIIGNYADRKGRKSALTLTIALMTAGTGIIALVPTYSSIGLLAPVLVVTGRALQGLSAGGEFGSATAYLAEQSPERRGFFASFQFTSQALAAMIATGFGVVITTTLSPDQIEAWGWRIPFLFGLLIGPVGYYIRRRLTETPEFLASPVSERPLHEALSQRRQTLLVGFGIVVFGTVGAYMIVFMPTFAMHHLGLAAADAFAAGVVAAALQMIVIPISAAVCDRYGRVFIALGAVVVMSLAIYPLFAWLAEAPSFGRLITVQVVVGTVLAVYGGALAGLLVDLFPTRIRTTGMSLSYAMAVAIFGGFAPFINAWLVEVTESKAAPSFYFMVAGAITFAALLGARRLKVR
jgi:MHS family proline/betaine transporter-like MFS transporter